MNQERRSSEHPYWKSEFSAQGGYNVSRQYRDREKRRREDSSRKKNSRAKNEASDPRGAVDQRRKHGQGYREETWGQPWESGFNKEDRNRAHQGQNSQEDFTLREDVRDDEVSDQDFGLVLKDEEAAQPRKARERSGGAKEKNKSKRKSKR